MTSLDALNLEVTAAIIAAETLERDGQPAEGAYRKVCDVEAQLAAALPGTHVEGEIARLGAVQAALRSGDAPRALGLASAYLPELGAAAATEMHKLIDQAHAAMAAATTDPAPAAPAPVQVGDRVQLHPGADRWMMGDRYGDVVGSEPGRVRVRLDRSGETLWFRREDVLPAR